ncbi:Twin-arginine translocation pathway signal [Pleurostoma richardsiae]|uniref:Twin-arginine translocation pathway signal n=1 Tax=Pleurostoma richardsiae TaxID=41990 RepID=A0AA38VJH3_9PEZI|nr:Twin-arginine translocation pathway signal [Pleurostoma richardsiae]
MARCALLFTSLLAALSSRASAAPVSEAQKAADPNYGPVPGESPLYSSYSGVEPVFPGNLTDPILPTKKGPPGPDDETWQNLLSAEWIIYSFYQQGVEAFNASSFADAGYPNTTYQRIMEIRNNENGHLRIFQNQISPTSVKPGPCKYEFPFYDPTSFLAITTVLEISSMAFLTGLVQQAKIDMAKGAMLAIAETETRHETWTLLDIWKTDPFAGPSDTVFPYANQILDTTNSFIVAGSCPKANPEYPHPRQKLPALSAAEGTTSLTPGSTITLAFTDATNQPKFSCSKQYYAVFFHGVANISVPIETAKWPEEKINVTIPADFETKGVIVAVIADTPGAPTKETVVAGPGIMLEQPVALGTALL